MKNFLMFIVIFLVFLSAQAQINYPNTYSERPYHSRSEKIKFMAYLKQEMSQHSVTPFNINSLMHGEDSWYSNRLSSPGSINCGWKVNTVFKKNNNWTLANGKLKKTPLYFVDISFLDECKRNERAIIIMKQQNAVTIDSVYNFPLFPLFDKNCCDILLDGKVSKIAGARTFFSFFYFDIYCQNILFDHNYYYLSFDVRDSPTTTKDLQ